MKNLTPHFIFEKYQAGLRHGIMPAAGIFIDISGFTQLTEVLMEHGKHGSEVLAAILNNVFTPLVQLVYDYGGFITKFAGDAFTAVFPGPEADACLNALTSGWMIGQEFAKNPNRETEYGTFTFAVKIGLTWGQAEWGIFEMADNQNTYYFKGSAIGDCALAEHHAEKGDIILTDAIYTRLADKTKVEPRDNHYRLLDILIDLPQPGRFHMPRFEYDIVASFSVAEVLNLPTAGEFRTIICSFININKDPDHDELEQFVQTLTRLRKQYGGYLTSLDFGDKGCNLLMMWGAPTSFENDLERALNFALDLRQQSDFELRIGLTYQHMFAGFAGADLRGEYTCYGRGVNLSARFMMAANWGDIWIDQPTTRRARTVFDVQPVGRLLFKGFSDPMPVNKLIQRKEFVESALFTREMIGRETELKQLRTAIQPIFDGKFAGLTYVYGEAGMGKSRLIYEIEQELKGLVKWLVCPCEEILRQSLNPFKYALRSYFKQSTERTLEENKANFEGIFSQLVEELKLLDKTGVQEIIDELHRTQSFLGAMVDIYYPGSLYEQLEPRGRYENTLTAFKTLIRAESLLHPIVLEIEDGHWIEQNSEDMLSTLTRNLEHEPIVIVAACRYRDDGSPFTFDLESDISTHVVDLNYMDRDGVAAFARQILQNDISPALVDLLIDRTQGNPFFVEQMALYLQEQNLLEMSYSSDKQPAGLTTRSTDVIIPGDVNAVLISRLDRLTADVRQVTQTASVLGREFEIQILSNMLRNDLRLPDKIKAVEHENIWSPLSEIRYIFRHALMRDLAYDMQLRARLRELHKLAGEAFEIAHSEDLLPYLGDIAYHYEQADVSEKALDYLIKAGDKAADDFANEQALDYYHRALKQGPAYDQEVHIREKIGETLILVGRYPDAQTNFQSLLDLARRDEDAAKEGLALSKIADTYMSMGQFPEALQHQQQALAIFRKLDYQKGMALAQHGLGNIYLYQQDLPNAREHYQQALTIRQKTGERNGEARTTMNIGTIHYYEGDVDKALAFFQTAKEIFVETNDLKNQAMIATNMGFLFTTLASQIDGEQELKETIKKALTNYDEAVKTTEKIGDMRNLALTLNNLGVLHADITLDYEQAFVNYRRALRIRREILDKHGLADTLQNIGYICYLRQAYQEGVTFCQEAKLISDEVSSFNTKYEACLTMGNLYQNLNNLQKAEAEIREAVSLASELNDPSLEIKAKMNLAKLYNAQSKHSKFEKLRSEIENLLMANPNPTLEKELENLAAKY